LTRGVAIANLFPEIDWNQYHCGQYLAANSVERQFSYILFTVVGLKCKHKLYLTSRGFVVPHPAGLGLQQIVQQIGKNRKPTKHKYNMLYITHALQLVGQQFHKN